MVGQVFIYVLERIEILLAFAHFIPQFFEQPKEFMKPATISMKFKNCAQLQCMAFMAQIGPF